MEKQLHTTTEEILKRKVPPVKNFHGLGNLSMAQVSGLLHILKDKDLNGQTLQ